MMQGVEPCPHCGSRRLAIDMNGFAVVCTGCGCTWQMRMVLINKPWMCTSDEVENEEDTLSADERLRGL